MFRLMFWLFRWCLPIGNRQEIQRSNWSCY